MSESGILNINKPIGITSYDVIRELKKKYPGQKIGHAGTLDPLASGVLVCLVGSRATRRQAEFMNAEKEYEFEIIFGFETDTYDVLGILLNYHEYVPKDNLVKIPKLLQRYVGKIEQAVPPFSAVKVRGRPLYRWYLDGRICEVKVPVKSVNVKSLEIIKSAILSQKELRERIFDLVNSVKSGFRQKSILEKWIAVFEDYPCQNNTRYLVLTLKAVVSKGTYVRAIAHDVGQKLGIGGCTLNITRTKVGDFTIVDSKRLHDL